MKLILRFVIKSLLSKIRVFKTVVFILGSSSSILQAQTFPGSTGALTDNNCSGTFNTFSATVSGVGATDIIQSLTINISHTWVGDMNLFLVNPTGAIIELSTANGGSGDNYLNTIFSDGAASYITTGSAPYTGSFKPEGRTNNDNQCDPPGSVGTYTFASQFGGANPNGNWILKIKDGAADDIGVLNSWSVTIVTSATLPKVGINTLTPQSTLDVNGKIKIGNDVAPQAPGMIRYSTAVNDFEGFNGSTWKSMTGSSGGGSGNGLVHPTAGSTFESGTNNPAMTGVNNTAIGVGAGSNFTNGEYNTAFGKNALNNTELGINNTAFGYNALSENWYSSNSAFGYNSLANHFEGNANSAFGSEALFNQTGGYDNCAFGNKALYSNNQGEKNSAFGSTSLSSNLGGIKNTAAGYGALANNTTGGFNTAVGFNAFATGTNYFRSTAIGYQSTITADDQIRIGNANAVSIGGYQAWSNLSDKRFKKNINNDVAGLDFIKRLRPVTYELDIKSLNNFLDIPDSLRNSELENLMSQNIHYGFIAQEVEELVSSLAIKFDGVEKPQNEKDHYAIRYSLFVVPLVKAVQEQQVMIESLIRENEMLKENKVVFLTENTVLREDFRQLAAELKVLREIILKKEDISGKFR